MDKKQQNRNVLVVCIVFVILLMISLIEFAVFPERIQLYNSGTHLVVQVILLIISLGVIVAGFFYFRKLAKNFDREFNANKKTSL
jgi:hypothetical protein